MRLARLGRKLGFDVVASGCPEANNREWLYDLAWYENRAGVFHSLDLAMESENVSGGSIANADAVDDDTGVVGAEPARVVMEEVPADDVLAAPQRSVVPAADLQRRAGHPEDFRPLHNHAATLLDADPWSQISRIFELIRIKSN